MTGPGRTGIAFLGLLGFPGYCLAFGRSLIDRAEDMGMTVAHLGGYPSRHRIEIEPAGFPRHLCVKDDLEQEIAQLVLQLVHIAALDRIRDLVGFLDRVGRNGLECLFPVPGAPVIGIAETGHNVEQVVDGRRFVLRLICHPAKLGEIVVVFD